MEWRIRESGHGGYMAEKGIQTEPGTLAQSGIGYIMPAFIVYESAHFDTYKQALKYVECKKAKPSLIGRLSAI